jgi:hypothetical protein
LQQGTPRLLVGTDKSVTRLASKLTKLHDLLLLTPLRVQQLMQILNSRKGIANGRQRAHTPSQVRSLQGNARHAARGLLLVQYEK